MTSTTPPLETLDDHLEKMNVQNGLCAEERENGNSLTTIVPMEDRKAKPNLANKSRVKSPRGDSTDALLGDDDKSSFDENNSTN